MDGSEDSDAGVDSAAWTESASSASEAVLHPNKKLAAKYPWRVLSAFSVRYK